MAENQIPARPTKVLQEAVNLALQGKSEEANKKVDEHPDPRNNRASLRHFLKVRQDKGEYEVQPFNIDEKEKQFDQRLSAIESRCDEDVE